MSSEKLLKSWEALKALGEGVAVEWKYSYGKYWSSAKCTECQWTDPDVLFRVKPPPKVKLDGVGAIVANKANFTLDAIVAYNGACTRIDAKSILARELKAMLADRIVRNGGDFKVDEDGKSVTCTFTAELCDE